MSANDFIVRTLEITDAKLLFEMVQNNRARLIDYFPISIGAMQDVDSTKAYIQDKIKQAEKKESFSFAIICPKDLKPIGMLFIKSLDWRIPKAELAYYIDKEYEGKGVVSKALEWVVSYAFNELKINKLFLRVAPDNLGSKRVAEKNGFVIEGVLRNDFKKGEGTFIDLLYYGRLRK
jgi:RimJ/RimL family protein N-acetyltransferase